MNYPFRQPTLNNYFFADGQEPPAQNYDELQIKAKGDFALVEVFRTYWQGFNSIHQYKTYLNSLNEDLLVMLGKHQEKRIGLHLKHDKRVQDKLLDQNHLIMITSADEIGPLQVIAKKPKSFHRILKDNRIEYFSKVISLS